MKKKHYILLIGWDLAKPGLKQKMEPGSNEHMLCMNALCEIQVDVVEFTVTRHLPVPIVCTRHDSDHLELLAWMILP